MDERAVPRRDCPFFVPPAGRGHPRLQSASIRVSGTGTLLRIAIRWMMCQDRHPPPTPPYCLFEKRGCRPLAGSSPSTKDPEILPSASGPRPAVAVKTIPFGRAA